MPSAASLLLVALIAGAATTHAAVEGLHSDDGEAANAVFGGEKAKENEIPFQVAIEWDSKLKCGGSIVTENWVLTSAACINTTATMVVRAGSLKSEKGGTVFPVASTVVHEKYNAETSDYDVALIKVQKAFPFDKPNIGPVTLTDSDRMPDPDAQVGVSGWGQQGSPEPGDDLTKTMMNILERRLCRGVVRVITDRMLCGIDPYHGTCTVDRGGPVIGSNGDQLGIVSSQGALCTTWDFVGTYTDLSESSIKEFIRNHTAK